MSEEGAFPGLLDKYSEYLTDASNRDDLLALGRRIFSASSTETENRPSFLLLKQKESDLSTKYDHNATKSKVSSSKMNSNRSDPDPIFTQDQINEEIKSLQEENRTLREKKRYLETQKQSMIKEYNQMIEDSVVTKSVIKDEMQKLKAELSLSLQRAKPAITIDSSSSITSILKELSDLNNQILQRIKSFNESTRDALSHSERAVLDRYKPLMEQVMNQIYDNADHVPIDELIKRYNRSSQKIEDDIRQFEHDLQNEHNRNERLQMDTRQLDEKLNAQRDEVLRLKKQQAQYIQDIARLNEVSLMESADLKSQYQNLLQTDESSDVIPQSARAIVVSSNLTKQRRELKKTPSQKNNFVSQEFDQPSIPSVEEFIEQERQYLMKKLRNSTE